MDQQISVPIYFAACLNTALQRGVIDTLDEVEYYRVALEDIRKNAIKPSTKEVTTKFFDKMVSRGGFKSCDEVRLAMNVHYSLLKYEPKADETKADGVDRADRPDETKTDGVDRADRPDEVDNVA